LATNIFGVFKGVGAGIMGGIAGGLKALLYIIPILTLAIIFIIHFRNRSIYKYPVRVFRIRENGKVKESNYLGGYIGRKNSAPFFRIKRGRLPWQYIDLTTTPIVKYMDEEDRIYYLQIDVDTFVQLKRNIDLRVTKLIKNKEGKITGIKLNKKDFEFSPVESDIKYGAILATQKIRTVLRAEPTWKKVLPYFGLVLMAVIFIVAYALLMDKC